MCDIGWKGRDLKTHASYETFSPLKERSHRLTRTRGAGVATTDGMAGAALSVVVDAKDEVANPNGGVDAAI